MAFETHDIETDEEGYVIRDGERLRNPFSGELVTGEQMEQAQAGSKLYGIMGATFVLNMFGHNGSTMKEMLEDETIEHTQLIGALAIIAIDSIQKLGGDVEELMVNLINELEPGLFEAASAEALAELVEEGELSMDEAAKLMAEGGLPKG